MEHLYNLHFVACLWTEFWWWVSLCMLICDDNRIISKFVLQQKGLWVQTVLCWFKPRLTSSVWPLSYKCPMLLLWFTFYYLVRLKAFSNSAVLFPSSRTEEPEPYLWSIIFFLIIELLWLPSHVFRRRKKIITFRETEK